MKSKDPTTKAEIRLLAQFAMDAISPVREFPPNERDLYEYRIGAEETIEMGIACYISRKLSTPENLVSVPSDEVGDQLRLLDVNTPTTIAKNISRIMDIFEQDNASRE